MQQTRIAGKTIVILHRIPHHKVRYQDVVDHDSNDVYYVTTDDAKDIPSELRHTKIQVPEHDYIEGTICRILNLGISVDTVIALSEYNLIAAQLIRSAIGIGLPDSASVFNCRDKGLMKRCIERADIRVAESILISSYRDLKIRHKPQKFVIKPTRGASSEGTRLVDNDRRPVVDGELRRRLEACESFLIEEFVDGPVLHFDGVVVDGKIMFAIGSQYIGNCLAFASGQPLASAQIDSTDSYREWVAQCVAAVGIRQGAFHLEGILSKDGMVFLEIGRRAGGAGVVECTRRALGVNLMQEEVRLELEGPQYVSPKLTMSGHRFGWFVVPDRAFNPSATAESLRDCVPGLIDLTINEQAQECSSVSYSSEHNPCTGIIVADDNAGVVRAIDAVLEMTTTVP